MGVEAVWSLELLELIIAEGTQCSASTAGHYAGPCLKLFVPPVLAQVQSKELAGIR